MDSHPTEHGPIPAEPSSVTLRQSLYWRFCALVIGAVLLLAAGYAWFGAQPVARHIAESQFEIAATRVAASVDRRIGPVEDLIRVARRWAREPGFDVENTVGFNQLFRPVLEENAAITSVVAGTTDGQGWLLLALPEGGWRNRMTDRVRWGDEHRFTDIAPDGSVTVRNESLDYDPRRRPWYELAMSAPDDGRVNWTEPYRFFTTGDPGITASSRVNLDGGRNLVVGFDIMLRDLSRETSRIEVGRSGFALLLTDDGRVLGLPGPALKTEGDRHAAVLAAAEELGLPSLTDAIRHWRTASRPQDEVQRFSTGGKAWLASWRSYPIGEQRLWIATLAPQADFSPAWAPLLAALAAIMAIVIGFALFIARAFARQISEPVEALVDTSRRMAALDFTPSPPPASRLREMQQLVSAQDSVRSMLGKYRDTVEEQARTLQDQIAALHSTEARLQLVASVFTHAQEGISITDASGRIVEVNDAFTRITGYSREEAIGQTPSIHRSGRHPPEFYAALWRDLLAKGHWYGEIWNRRKNGELYAETLSITAVCDRQGQPLHYVALFTDITLLKEHQKQLEHVTHYDALTGLPNRVLLADRVRQAIAQTRRRDKLMALVCLDLDGFKPVNDAHGHEVGDELLVAISARMKDALREGDTLARLGGDEFVIVLTDLEDPAECNKILSRLLRVAAAPVHVRNLTLQVSASLGVTLHPMDGSDPDTLLRHADQAMYQAKQAGKNRYHLFDPEQDRLARSHHESLEHIALALENNEFVLHYQPKVNMRSGEVIGAEALLRWQHPERGLVAPGAFLPLIEDNDIIVRVGDWVIDTALAQIVRWSRDGLNMTVSVNISARQLQRDDFVSRLMERLAAYPEVAPEALELEVLETAALEDIARVSQVMEVCRNLGVSFALDDFGTGYSSLTYLKRLPANELKIDQSFVRDMLSDPEDMAIVEGIIGLAAAFRRTVIAEGVETAEHGQLLLRLGCDLGQGYGIARPMPADDLLHWVHRWKPDPSWLVSTKRPLGREDLPLLFAEIEHRQWVRTLESVLTTVAPTTHPSDSAQCRFGAWYRTEGQARYGHLPEFEALDSIHERIHELGAEALTLHTEGQDALAQDRFARIAPLSERLVSSLRALSVAIAHRSH